MRGASSPVIAMRLAADALGRAGRQGLGALRLRHGDGRGRGRVAVPKPAVWSVYGREDVARWFGRNAHQWSPCGSQPTLSVGLGFSEPVPAVWWSSSSWSWLAVLVMGSVVSTPIDPVDGPTVGAGASQCQWSPCGSQPTDSVGDGPGVSWAMTPEAKRARRAGAEKRILGRFLIACCGFGRGERRDEKGEEAGRTHWTR